MMQQYITCIMVCDTEIFSNNSISCQSGFQNITFEP
jgi:hypothetical protein